MSNSSFPLNFQLGFFFSFFVLLSLLWAFGLMESQVCKIQNSVRDLFNKVVISNIYLMCADSREVQSETSIQC